MGLFSMLAPTMLLAASTPPSSDTLAVPDVLTFGATTAEMEERLRPLCQTLRTRRIDPPFLESVRTEQLQIDCDGFSYRGRSRHVEFVIRDGRLVMVWLMVDREEEDRTIADMVATLGAPTSINDRYVAFADHRIAWRYEPPELLFYGPEIAAEIEPWFDNHK